MKGKADLGRDTLCPDDVSPRVLRPLWKAPAVSRVQIIMVCDHPRAELWGEGRAGRGGGDSLTAHPLVFERQSE